MISIEGAEMENTLYYGDNLDILRRYIADESVDLVYLDPPFKSNQNYNVLFKEKNGKEAASQIRAFEDTWSWGQDDEGVYEELVTKGGKVADCLKAFRTFMGACDMLSYLVMMAPRLVELRRVIKSTASIYLHCDPAASHYLKMLMDAVFSPGNFRNEVVWIRTASKGLMTRRLPNNHDVILNYQKTPAAKWNLGEAFQPYDPAALDPKTAAKYCHRDPDGRLYQLSDLTNPNPNRPNLTYEFLGITKVWRWTRERMQAAYDAGFVIKPSPGSIPRLKRYLDKQRGRPLTDVWGDISPLNSQAKERLGYPTQKPEALLERIIQTSSNEGDLVLDPFCGCGTTIAAAQKLNRRWIGIDITHLAITLMKTRLMDTFGTQASFKVVGEPASPPDAKALAESDPYQFQWWALGLVGARPEEQKKGADKGIDGKIIFHEGAPGEFDEVVLSVKAGHVTVSQVRDLRGVVDRQKAAIGVLISMEQPTKPMEIEAATAGFYESVTWNQKYPKLQLLTIEELLSGKKIDMPPIRQVQATFKKAERFKEDKGEQLELKEKT